MSESTRTVQSADKGLTARCDVCGKHKLVALIETKSYDAIFMCVACLVEKLGMLDNKQEQLSRNEIDQLFEKAQKLARAGDIAELQEWVDEAAWLRARVVAPWLDVAIAWDELDEARRILLFEKDRTDHLTRALLAFLRECRDEHESAYNLRCNCRWYRRLDAWISKPLVDDNGLGPDGVCLQCATASGTDHVQTCAFRPGADKTYFLTTTQRELEDRIRESNELRNRDKDSVEAEKEHLADLLGCDPKFGPIGHAIERLVRSAPTGRFADFVLRAKKPDSEIGYGEPCLAIPCPRCDGNLMFAGFSRDRATTFIKCHGTCKEVYTVGATPLPETPD